MKAKRVPMFVNSANLPNGTKPEKMDTSKHVIHVFTTGVCFFSLIFEKALAIDHLD